MYPPPGLNAAAGLLAGSASVSARRSRTLRRRVMGPSFLVCCLCLRRCEKTRKGRRGASPGRSLCRSTDVTQLRAAASVIGQRTAFSARKEPSMTAVSWRALAALLAVVFVTAPVAGQPEIPQTPAGKVFAAWLTSFNSADPAQIKAFDAAYPRKETPPVEARLQFRAATGGFTPVRGR